MSDRLRLDIPLVRIGLEKRATRHWLWRECRPDRRHLPGYVIGEQHVLGFMLQIVRMAEGPDWFPRRLEVEASARDWAGKRPEILGEAMIEFGAARTAIELPSGSLDRRLQDTGSKFEVNLSSDVGELPAANLKGSLHQALRSVVYEQGLSLALGAELSCVSERSLQRFLADEETSWREVVDRVHLETALDLMDDRTNSLADIAATLGYGHYPNFYRAFQRWTGESPSAYRKRLDS